VENHDQPVPQTIEDLPDQYSAPLGEETVTFTLRLTGPVSKMRDLKQYILDSGIMAEPIAE
ncbi:hypothetical protein P8631_12315, partial [Guyparkeria sp. 1SP6A2]|nr:hypothetical protein [Guyparkeria sp. 1SP6A2]